MRGMARILPVVTLFGAALIVAGLWVALGYAWGLVALGIPMVLVGLLIDDGDAASR